MKTLLNDTGCYWYKSSHSGNEKLPISDNITMSTVDVHSTSAQLFKL